MRIWTIYTPDKKLVLKNPPRPPRCYMGLLVSRAAHGTEALAAPAALTLLLNCLMKEKHSAVFSYSFYAKREGPNRSVRICVIKTYFRD